jgi:nitrite reductase/ring-hydroxylating ferredoxin subunit
MPTWHFIATVEQCPPGEPREFLVEDRIVALFQVDGRFYALDGICPHQGGPLGRGSLCGAVVTCPWHGWQFDVVTGRHQANPTLQQARFSVKIEDQNIFVAVTE